jgi:sporulation protein YlmC with PRC-barrel domain
VVVKKTRLIGPLLIVLVLGNVAKGGIGMVANGSFEDDGLIENIAVEEPNGWDVNLPDATEFGGYVDTEWATEGTYNLTLHSRPANFEANDIVTVSQAVYLTDVNEVVFDLKLESYHGWAWDPNKVTALLLVDGEVVWESNSVGADVRGEYVGQVYDVNEIYQGAGPHELALGLRVNVTALLSDYFQAQWDFVTVELCCDDLGLVPGDITRDCYVDMDDVRELSDVWLEETGANSKYDLYPDANGLVSFPDYSVLADNWLASSYD